MEAQIKFRSLGEQYDRKVVVKESHINNGFAVDYMIKTNAWHTLHHLEGYSTFTEALESATSLVKALRL
jgi:hypothetical protein